METPFDNFISRLWQLMSSTQHQNPHLSEMFLLVYNFSTIARVLYGNMAKAAETMQLNIHAQYKRGVSRTLAQEEMPDLYDDPIRCRLSYMQFIEHINITGRVLKQKGYPLPLYRRVYFFRNKMIEHWDDYLQLLTASTGGGINFFSGGKISIPYFLAGISRSDRQNLQQELIDAFTQWGITLPSLEGKWYGEYSDIIYVALEKIDGELRKFDKKTGVGIPDPIVTLLFKYSFPTPICDMEEYCKTLAEWLETLPLQ